jgi:hypothetical protein
VDFSAPARSHWIYTMYRCLAIALTLTGLHVAASAQVQRNFPPTALRGELVVLAPPEITLNGGPSRLSPGSRIRAQDNMLQMSGALVGRKLAVNYTLDLTGMVHEVWILRPEEVRMRPWPRTPTEAATWSFDPVAQVWSKP